MVGELIALVDRASKLLRDIRNLDNSDYRGRYSLLFNKDGTVSVYYDGDRTQFYSYNDMISHVVILETAYRNAVRLSEKNLMIDDVVLSVRDYFWKDAREMVKENLPSIESDFITHHSFSKRR